jgi:predicted ribosomally synthesized peptide with nif11-like leader
MSAQTARKFLEFVNTNPGVQTQLRVSDPRTLDKLLNFAHGKGYIVSAEELEAALNEFPSSPLMDSIRARARVRA